MAERFDLSHIQEYLARMNLSIAHIEREQQTLELAFQHRYKQWRMIVSIQQVGNARKLLLLAPHIATVTATRRMECLEALLAINYRIALGKFGLDLEDGEIRLEETIPLADYELSFAQFQLAVGAIIQTVSMYYNLLPRIQHSHISVEEAIQECERDFFQSAPLANVNAEVAEISTEHEHQEEPELDVEDVLAEVA
ncbi:MAG TPA: YbjN domain-containing protein, partial [Ktedonobacteraceae bacterium]|nr:YbjN domain-containing protein [Ktedonobacteraceae bacterium]